jgi:hypothetical protein
MTITRRTGAIMAFITAGAFALTAASSSSSNSDSVSRYVWIGLAVLFAISGLKMLRGK